MASGDSAASRTARSADKARSVAARAPAASGSGLRASSTILATPQTIVDRAGSEQLVDGRRALRDELSVALRGLERPPGDDDADHAPLGRVAARVDVALRPGREQGDAAESRFERPAGDARVVGGVQRGCPGRGSSGGSRSSRGSRSARRRRRRTGRPSPGRRRVRRSGVGWRRSRQPARHQRRRGPSVARPTPARRSRQSVWPMAVRARILPTAPGRYGCGCRRAGAGRGRSRSSARCTRSAIIDLQLGDHWSRSATTRPTAVPSSSPRHQDARRTSGIVGPDSRRSPARHSRPSPGRAAG